jgi:hypothetical protein
MGADDGQQRGIDPEVGAGGSDGDAELDFNKVGYKG